MLTNSTGGIPQKLFEYESLDILEICTILKKSSIMAESITYFDFIENCQEMDISGINFFYASSQYLQYKLYIEDILLDIERRGGKLLPKYDLLKCHEDKFYQELIKRRLSIPSPKAILIGSVEDPVEKCSSLKFPCVVKTPDGYGSIGVALLKNMKELKQYIEKNTCKTIGGKRKKDIKNGDYPARVGRIIVQELIPNLNYDWKVLVFGNRLFTLKRYVRKGEFRASGSGNFDFNATPPEKLITFCYKVRRLLNTPFVSLDVVEKNDELLVIEFQCIHFGPYTAINSKRHYSITETLEINEIVKGIDINELYAQSLLESIN